MIKRKEMSPKTKRYLRRAYAAKKGWITRKYGSLENYFKVLQEQSKNCPSLYEAWE